MLNFIDDKAGHSSELNDKVTHNIGSTNVKYFDS